jgi:hypothetical protein
LDSLLVEYGYPSVVTVRYHGDVPWEFDPFYMANPGEYHERYNYYELTSMPSTLIDGAFVARTCFVTRVKEALDAALEVASPLKVLAADSLVGDSCFVDVRVIAEQPTAGDSLVLRAAVVEDSIAYDAPNGLHLFNYVFRRFLPDHAGTVFAISQGETLDFHFAFMVDPEWDADHISTLAFCQNDTDRSIVQAATTKPRPPAWGRYRAAEQGRVVVPGHGVEFPGTFTNLGAGTDTFDLDIVSDLPSDWSAGYAVSGGIQVGSAVVLESDSSCTIEADMVCGYEPGTGECTITVTSRRDPSFTRSLKFFAVSGVCALLVDDDGGLDLETYYAGALDSLGVLWGHWDRRIARPLLSDLTGAEFVIWFTGSYFPTLETYDQDLIGSYLDGGGDLFISGQDIGFALNYVNNEEYSPEAVDFYETYLHASWVTSSSLLWQVSGRSGDPISDGLMFSIEGGDGADNQDYPDVIDPIGAASVVFDYTGDPTKHGGVRYDSGASKIVYLAFGFEAISTEADRELLLSRIIDWFGKTSGVEEPPVAAAVSIYPNPAAVCLNINFAGAWTGGAVEIYDVLGRLVRSLGPVRKETMAWDLVDESNRRVAPGVYFVSVSTGHTSIRTKVILTR